MLRFFSENGILLLLWLAVFSGCKENTQSMSGSTTGPEDEEIDWTIPESPTELMELSRRLKQRSDREIEILIDRLKFDASVPPPNLGEPLEEIAEELLTLTLSEADRLGSLLEELGRGTELALTIADRQAQARAAVDAIQKRLTKLPEGYRDGDLYIASPLVVEKVKLPWLERQTGQKFEQVIQVSFAREEYDFGPMPTDVSDHDMRFVGMLTGLRKLDIQQSEVGERGLRELRHLQQLAVLDASGLNATSTGWEVLTGLANLRQLKLRVPQETPTEIGWAGEFPKLERLEAYNLSFSQADLLKLCRCRTLRTLLLYGKAPNEEQLIVRRMPQLKELQLGLRIDREHPSASLKIEHLPKLEKLNPSISRERDDPRPARLEKLELSDLPRLNSVYLTVEEFGTNGLMSLGRLPALKYLELAGMTIPGETFHWLAGLNRLTHLNCTTDAGDRALQSLSNIKTLTHLRLFTDETTDVGVKAISELSELTSLSLTGIQASNELSACLLKLPKLKELTLGDGTVRSLALSEHPSLGEVQFNRMDIDEISLASLPNLKRFEMNYGKFEKIKLNNLPKLSWCQLTCLEPDRVESVQLTELPALIYFSLGPIDRRGSIETPMPPFKLGDEFLKQFVPMSKLQNLWLHHTLVTDEGLMKLGHLIHLGSRTFSGPNVTEAGRMRLREAIEARRREVWQRRKAEDASKSD